MRLFSRIFLFVTLACALSQAQDTFTPLWPAGLDDRNDMGWATDHATTTIQAPVAIGDTAITVANGSLFETNNLVTMDDTGEVEMVCAVAPTSLTLCAGSTDAHAVNTVIHCSIDAKYWNRTMLTIAAMQRSIACAAGFYEFMQLAAATPVQQRAKLNFVFDGGITGTVTDNSGNGSTDVHIGAPGATGIGTNWQALQDDGVAQTAAPTLNVKSGTGISVTGAHNSGTNAEDLTISATGSGAGNKTAYAAFPVAGCAGSASGAAIDLPSSGAPTANCYGSTLRFGALDFASGANQSAQISFPLPGDWTASSTVAVQLNWFSTAGSSSSTIWSAKTFCASSSTVLTGTITWNAAGTVTTTNNVTPLTRAASTISGISAAGCSAGLELWMQIQRTDSAAGTVSLKSASVAVQRTY